MLSSQPCCLGTLSWVWYLCAVLCFKVTVQPGNDTGTAECWSPWNGKWGSCSSGHSTFVLIILFLYSKIKVWDWNTLESLYHCYIRPLSLCIGSFCLCRVPGLDLELCLEPVRTGHLSPGRTGLSSLSASREGLLTVGSWWGSVLDLIQSISGLYFKRYFMSSLLEAGVDLIWAIYKSHLPEELDFIYLLTKVTEGRVWTEALEIQEVYLACKHSK